MSFNQLKKAKWEKLDRGLDYNSKDKGKANEYPFVRLTVEGFEGPKAESFKVVYPQAQSMIESLLVKRLNQKLADCKSGYLRADIFKMMEPEHRIIMIYLMDSYDTSRIEKDIQFLKAIPNVEDVTFISKEEAKKSYLDEGNPDWSEILAVNPLPMAFEFRIATDNFNSKWEEDFKQRVLIEIPFVADIPISKSEELFEIGNIIYYKFERYKTK